MIQESADSSRSYNKGWLFISALLIIAIIAGGTVFGLKQWHRGNSIEIIPASVTSSNLNVYLDGAITNEGIYVFSLDSSLRDILQAAGEITGDADSTSLIIHIPATNESSLIRPQKININKAESWLLEALPGIGSTLAQRIIDYRETKGPFQSIDELDMVEGIGPATIQKLSDKICVIS